MTDDRDHDVLHATLDWLGGVAPGARLVADSRRVRPGDVFVAQPGGRADGRAFIDAAVASGAAAVLHEAHGAELRAIGVPSRGVADLSRIAGRLASAFYGDPSAHMRVFAITGTNGKTTCASWIAQALERLGHRCATIGTLGVGFAGTLDGTGLTTPDVWRLHEALRDLRARGADALAIEASSIGLHQGRLDGLHIDVAVFTNLTRDHLDYHGTMAAYEAAKAQLFDWSGLRAAALNRDDPAGLRLVARAQARGLPTVTFSTLGAPDTDLVASDIHTHAAGMRFSVEVQKAARFDVELASLGEHNVSNWLACTSALIASGVAVRDAVDAMRGVRAAQGRLELIFGAPHDAHPLVVVDYAHTPDALDHALNALHPVAQVRGGRLVALFGCGGNRDKGKRPLMAQIASARADLVVLTSDNPRLEDPRAILDEIVRGLVPGTPYWIDADRHAAIRRAIAEADARDVVLIAGKGHERTQDIAGMSTPFYDPDEARAALAARHARVEARP